MKYKTYPADIYPLGYSENPRVVENAYDVGKSVARRETFMFVIDALRKRVCFGNLEDGSCPHSVCYGNLALIRRFEEEANAE
jgi:hypothetical protein